MTTERADLAPIRILVVDDDADIRDVLRMTLEMALSERSHQIVTAANGQEALDSARDDRPTLVLLDLMMPVMGGAEFVTAMRKEARTREVPVVILSAWSREAENIPGVQGFLVKPIDMEALVRILDRYCA